MTQAPPRVIAEIGTSHDGDIVLARELVAAAAESGADTAKFQIVFADEILHPASGAVDLPGGSTPLYQRFRRLERDEWFYAEAKHAAEAAGIGFLCSVFGVHSAQLLRSIGGTEFKIASPELNHVELLREVNSYGLPIILSTGVSTLSDIAEAVSSLNVYNGVTLLHCITAYPAPPEEYNVGVIPTLSAITGLPVGISDHSVDPVLVPALATLLGASVVEKHIALSRRAGGLDDPIALEPAAFKKMTGAVREMSHRKRSADGSRRALHEMEARYGSDRISQILGDGVKRLAPSERENYGSTNRSIHAVTNLGAGDVLSEDNTAILRSEKNLSPGLHPRYWRTIVGRATSRPVNAGDGITWSHLLRGA